MLVKYLTNKMYAEYSPNDIKKLNTNEMICNTHCGQKYLLLKMSSTNIYVHICIYDTNKQDLFDRE